MSKDREAALIAKLDGLFEAIAQEARANPSFAAKLGCALTSLEANLEMPQKPSGAAAAPGGEARHHTILENVTFDPLECQIEAALIGGREEEARAFLGKLNVVQLDEVVKTQRLPGAKDLQKTIFDEDTAAAVDAIVGSAAERVRSRFSVAR